MSIAADGRLWVASESGARLYQQEDRPMTPQLPLFDVTHVRAWQRPECRV